MGRSNIAIWGVSFEKKFVLGNVGDDGEGVSETASVNSDVEAHVNEGLHFFSGPSEGVNDACHGIFLDDVNKVVKRVSHMEQKGELRESTRDSELQFEDPDLDILSAELQTVVVEAHFPETNDSIRASFVDE